MAATHLEGKGLKPTSTFIQMAPMELVVRETFLLDSHHRNSPAVKGPYRTEDMIVEYASTYMFGDFV
jgi:hypothetical protein